MGASGKDHISCSLPLSCKEIDLFIATDDGSIGKKGTAVDLLKNLLRSSDKKKNTVIYVCGPDAMLRAVAGTAEEYGLPVQVSVEEYMACGIGVCKGCAVKTKQGIKLVCKDGPVFDAEEIF